VDEKEPLRLGLRRHCAHPSLLAQLYPTRECTLQLC
jgi:hypothetical protein